MDANFWHRRWSNGEIGFHEGAPNALLAQYFARLDLKSGSRVFVPLCGKALDLAWLAAQGMRVAGIELSELAVTQFFAETGLTPEIAPAGSLMRYRAGGLEIFAGDFFALSANVLGRVDAIYDRAALIALPPEMRERYAAHLMAITDAAPQLLICTEYDQSLMDGPPFAVMADEVRRLYGQHYRIEMLARGPATIKRLQGIGQAAECAWLLGK